MIKWIPKYSLLFLICLILQVFIFNEMQISRFFNPSFYILFILLLPFETPRWVMLTSAFALGIGIDVFMNTPGLNASASVFAAFIRPGVLNLFSPRDGYEPGTTPRIAYYGFGWFLKYTIIITVSHQLVLFFLEAFTFNFAWMTLAVALINTILTSFFVILSQYMMFRR
ncbi:MAG TPA: rod shape-determining protein MreD [Bacteroidales bacterium]|nr:rod shape-determining protein MreD [Bacteroidales bacterium]